MRRATYMHVGGRQLRHKLYGCGMGSVLMAEGGAGAGSSYQSLPQYEKITGNRVSGMGLHHKLDMLSIKPSKSKPKNIRF